LAPPAPLRLRTTRYSLSWLRSSWGGFLPLVLCFSLALPAAAQECDIASCQERLPEETLFYLTWQGLDSFKELRATNPLLRFLDSPEMKANWEALNEFHQRQEEAGAKRKPEADSTEPQRTKSEMDLHKLAPLLSNPGLIAVVAPPATEAAAAERPEPGFIYLYDSAGKEDLLAALEARAAGKHQVTSEYDFEGTPVVETLDAKGKPKDYKARVGRWLVGGSDKAITESWIRRLQQAPARSLKDTAAYAHARTRHQPNAQLEFFLNLAAVSQLLQQVPIPTSKEAAVSPEQIMDAIGLDDWELVVATLSLERERARYDLAALHREGAGDLADFIAPSVADFSSLDFAPEDALSYSVVELDFSALWGYARRLLDTALPPQQARLAAGFQGMAEGVLGVTLDELTAAWGTEFAQITYPLAAGEEVHTLRAQSVRHPDQILAVLRNLLAALGPQLNFEELPPEAPDQPVTYFQLSLPSGDADEEAKAPFYLGLTENWLFLGWSRAEIEAALARVGREPNLRASATFQETRARFPSSLSSFSFIDAERWLASGDVAKLLEGMAKSMAEAARRRQEGDEAEAEAAEPETDEMEEPSAEGPELARREPEVPEIEPPQFQIPRGYLKLLLSATTKDAHGLYHSGYIE